MMIAHQYRRRRGAIFVTALGIIVVLTGMVLVFAESMRTEAAASAYRLAYSQADTIEQGAEAWVTANIDVNHGDSVTTTQLPAEAVQVGDGYFWILTPAPDTDQQYQFGITDEASKLNLNVAYTNGELLLLPNMTNDVSDSIGDWVDTDDTPNAEGAESDYYESLAEPYDAKNGDLETLEELLLVKGVTKDLLYGLDLNQDGVIDANEQALAGSSNLDISGNGDRRGWANYFTVYSSEPNQSTDGTARVNVNARDTTNLLNTLQAALGGRATTIVNTIQGIISGTRSNNTFPDLGAFYTASGMTAQEFGEVADKLTATASTTLKGMVNAATAPEAVLMCLPGLDQSDADTLISSRASADTTNIAWVFSALSGTKTAGVAGLITSRSFWYSADIVAVSGNGRAFKRVRIVVDDRTPPAKIVYRQDLTSLGWPLPPDLRTSMRTGKGVITGIGVNSTAGQGLPGGTRMQ